MELRQTIRTGIRNIRRAWWEPGLMLALSALLVAAACAGLMLKGGLMAPSLIALGLAGFSLYPVAMAWGCEEASRDELVTMNQLLLLSYSLGTLAGLGI